MLLFMVRHGETDWNRQGRSQGRTDVPLNASGRAQAAALSGGLAGDSLSAVYSSPLQRAHATAEAIAARHGLTVGILPGLAELDQGELDGLTIPEMREQYPGVLRRWNAGETSMRLPGGESMEEAAERAWLSIEAIRKDHAPSARVVVVSHNLVILACLCRALGLPTSSFRYLRQQPASMHVLDLTAVRNRMLRFNIACQVQAGNGTETVGVSP